MNMLKLLKIAALPEGVGGPAMESLAEAVSSSAWHWRPIALLHVYTMQEKPADTPRRPQVQHRQMIPRGWVCARKKGGGLLVGPGAVFAKRGMNPGPEAGRQGVKAAAGRSGRLNRSPVQ